MPALQFTGDLKLAILEGRKLQTLRTKLQRGLKLDARVTMMNGYNIGTVFGHAIITAIDLVVVADLTLDDARLDGFATLESLRARLARMKTQHEQLWRIRWRDFRPVSQLKKGR